MIDFRPFYQQIATTNLSAWLETLPLQLKEWEKQTHFRGRKTTHCPSFETIDAVAKRTLSFI